LTEKKFGSYGAVFGGAAYLSMPANADFNFADGTWTVDLWGKFTNFTNNQVLFYQKTDIDKVAFTSGSQAPVAGSIIVGAISSAYATVDNVTVSSGTWAGGDAAGYLYVQSRSGTYQAEDLGISGGAANVMTIGGATSDAGDNFIQLYINTSGQPTILIHECYGAGSDVVNMSSAFALTTATWCHVEISQNGNSWYLFVDGVLKYTGSSTARAKNYIGDVQLGYNNTNYLLGYLDEYRVSSTTRHTATFTPPAAAYSSATNVANVYVGSTKPLKGGKWYVKTANGATAAVSGSTWTNSGWTALTSLADGTSVGGKTLAQTGSITFDSTVANAKLRYIDGKLQYFYWFVFTGIDPTTTIYHMTLDAPFQRIVDFWDGVERAVDSFFKYTTTYQDLTLNVVDNTFTVADTSTYADLSTMAAYAGGNNCLLAGFFERLACFNIGIPDGKKNTTAGTTMSIDYWDGAQFTSVGAVIDGTSEGGISFSKSGTVSFTPPDSWLVFQTTIANNSTPMYYYRIRFDQALSAAVAIYYIAGIPGQVDIRGYKFPLHSQDRLMLCCNMDGNRNSMLVGATDTSQVFNGSDSFAVDFGGREELTCGCTVFSMYASTLYNITLIFKDQELWGLISTDNGWKRYKIASIGCAAPDTLDVAIIPPVEGETQLANRCLAVWCTGDGVYTSDGRHPANVSYDIRDLFDQNSPTHVNLSYIKSFSGFVDDARNEYHLLVALTTGTVTILDAEYVLDMRKWKWFKVERGIRIQCGLSVVDAYGNSHSYGFTNTGYMERLEYGTTFDGNPIVPILWFGDFTLTEGDPLTENSITAIIPYMASKLTASDLTLTHYVDCAAVGTDYTVDMAGANRVVFPVSPANSIPGLFHSFKMTITTTDETCNFQPFVLGLFYQPVRDHDYV
jgi:hypothetical protein